MFLVHSMLFYLKKNFPATAIILIGMLVFALRFPAPQPLSKWRVIPHDGLLAQPLTKPILLSDAIIWREFQTSALTYRSLDGKRLWRYDWLRGVPIQWDAFQQSAGITLLWRTSDERLWLALLNADGSQQSAPIPLSSDPTQDFRTAQWNSGTIMAVWRSAGNLYTSLINTEGRSTYPVSIKTGVEYFALSGNRIAWSEGDQLFIGKLTEKAIENIQPLPPAEGKITSLQIVGDRVLCGMEVLPDVEQYFFHAVDGSKTPLLLSHGAQLRWANTDGQTISLAVNYGEGWQPVLIDENNEVQLVEGAQATASPISFSDQTAAWVTLNENMMPVLYLATLNPEYGNLRYPFIERDIIRNLKNGYLGLIWLIAPLISLYFTRKKDYQLPVMLFLFWMSKIIFFPFGQFYQPLIPIVGITIITGIAGSIGWGRTAPEIRYTTYCLTDILLTFATFSVALQW